jgi:hypothetical protein
MNKERDVKDKFIRVGCDYFKVIEKPDRYGILRTELKKWKKDEIAQDYGRNSLYDVPQFDDFVIVPDNLNYKRNYNGCFNLYNPFSFTPKEGNWKWTEILLRHIFDEQYEIGLIYLQVLYLYPMQALPVLALVSKERQTGKSTFMDWLTTLFGQNMVILDAKNIQSEFNGVYATANIIGIEETFIDKNATIEKIKAISTQKTMTVNMKMIQHFSIPFFGKIIMNSNNEDKFIKIDQKEIRFLVRKLEIPKIHNHNILMDMVDEIPSFLHYLTTLPTPDFTKSRMVFTAEEISNNTLAKVKEKSKNWLYQELRELFKDFFENNHPGDDIMLASPIDVKQKYFHNNNQVQLSYLKQVLKEDFEFEKSDKIIRYNPFYVDSQKTGTPYKILKKDFYITEIPNIESKEEEELPF